MLIDREDLAWAAGIFEGEGCIAKQSSHRKAWHIGLSVENTDLELLEKFQRVIGNLGHIYKRKRRSTKHKRHWVWRTDKFEEVQATISYIWPWLLTRRRERAKELFVSYLTRHIPIKGTWFHKLSQQDVREIKKTYKTGRYTKFNGVALAVKFGVHPATIYAVLKELPSKTQLRY